MHRIVASIVALGALSACSYQVESNVSPPSPAIMAYTNKVPGKWALLVDAEKAAVSPEAEGGRCSRSDYQVDLSNAFGKVAAAAFARVGEDVRLSDHQMSHTELVSGGYTGVITLRVSDLRSHVTVAELIGGTAEASTTIEGSILVTREDQRLVDSTQSAKGEDQRDSGLGCGAAADALSAASGDAMQDLARKLAEQFANSRAVRYSSPNGLVP